MTTTWDLPEDPTKTGLEYPNYNIKKTASGHELIFDDTEGKESITIRHRTGSVFQLHPDGSVVMMSKNGAYQVTFGDHNMLVTGAHNITVNGPASMKVEGNYDMTVNGDAKHVYNGDVEHTINGNFTQMVSGDSEVVVSGDASHKVAGKSEYVASKAVMSTEGRLGLLAGSDIVASADGEVSVTASGGDISLDASSDVSIDASGSVPVSSSGLLTHNDTNVGSTHKHLDVIAGSDKTGLPTS